MLDRVLRTVVRQSLPKGMALLSQGKYLSALDLLSRENESWDKTPLAANLLMWAANAVDPWGMGRRQGYGVDEPPPAATGWRDPGTDLAEAMRGRRLLIVMDRPSLPETRLFGASVLPALRAAGATHLALDTTFQDTLDRFERDGVCRPDTESFSFEPARAVLVRAARAAGLKLAAYDQLSDNFALALAAAPIQRTSAAGSNQARAERLAVNVHRILQRDPHARVVVWAAEQHAMRALPSDYPWRHPTMAAHLARLTGETPFCVYQTVAGADDGPNRPLVATCERAWLEERGADAVVVHPRPAGAPAWVGAGSQRVDVESRGAPLVQAVPASEGGAAVPAAQWLTGGEARGSLCLAPGRYLLRGVAQGDVIAWDAEIAV